MLWFPAPASFTGDDVAELHVHGGTAVVASVLTALAGIAGCRTAEPGEFTKRAFLNGKLDLTQAEAIADLVAAETEAQQRQAVRQLDGELGRCYESWRTALVGALAHLEAAIDFPDEDLPAETVGQVQSAVGNLERTISAHLDDGRRGERLRDGFRIAIVGPPNVGKSSIINVLSRREAAIVAPQPGTTRDVVEVHLDLGGYPVTLADTAGLRETDDLVESEGVRRALARAEESDLKLVVIDAGAWPSIGRESLALIDENAIVIANKIDLRAVSEMTIEGRPVLGVSAKTNVGINRLLEVLQGEIGARFGARDVPTLSRLRHREALRECRDALSRALDGLQSKRGLEELPAEDLRIAIRAIGRITGRVNVEDILDVVFRDFCIGK